MATRHRPARRSPPARRRSAAPAGGRPSQSILVIDLAAIAANYRLLRRLVGRRGGCAAVVKADAYGLGAVRVVPALAAAGCRDFFVAELGEAEAIRKIVPRGAAIYVLDGLLAGEETLFRRGGFVPVLNDTGQVALWRRAARGGRGCRGTGRAGT